MKYIFMYDHRREFRVEKMAVVLKCSRSGYYRWVRNGFGGQKYQEQETLLSQILAVFKKSRKTYGARRISKELKRSGVHAGRRRVSELMRENNILPKTVKKFKATTNSNHNHPVSPNLLNREFCVDAPNRVWVSDMTYIWTSEGWLYLAAIKDLYSGRIVGWAMDKQMTQQLVINALHQAAGRQHPPRGVILHSDRGVQYAAKKYRNVLKSYGFRQSMSRKGDCWDNAPMESFFGTLKTELVYHENYKTRAEARASIFEYVESFYNRIRLQKRLGYLSPEDYEKQSYVA